jgi:hypothetical protein
MYFTPYFALNKVGVQKKTAMAVLTCWYALTITFHINIYGTLQAFFSSLAEHQQIERKYVSKTCVKTIFSNLNREILSFLS